MPWRASLLCRSTVNSRSLLSSANIVENMFVITCAGCNGKLVPHHWWLDISITHLVTIIPEAKDYIILILLNVHQY